MFNRNDNVDLLALQTEMNDDPAGMGYALVPLTDIKAMEKELNIPANNVGGETEGATFTQQVVLDTWEPKGNLNESTPWIQSLIASDGDITYLEARYRANCGTLSTTALDAVIVQLSRAEVLFGQGTTLSRDDIISARDYEV